MSIESNDCCVCGGCGGGPDLALTCPACLGSGECADACKSESGALSENVRLQTAVHQEDVAQTSPGREATVPRRTDHGIAPVPVRVDHLDLDSGKGGKDRVNTIREALNG